MMANVLRGATYQGKGRNNLFAQDIPAEVNGMLLSAQAAGCIDFVLPLNKIATKLVKIDTRVAQD